MALTVRFLDAFQEYLPVDKARAVPITFSEHLAGWRHSEISSRVREDKPAIHHEPTVAIRCRENTVVSCIVGGGGLSAWGNVEARSIHQACIESHALAGGIYHDGMLHIATDRQYPGQGELLLQGFRVVLPQEIELCVTHNYRAAGEILHPVEALLQPGRLPACLAG